MYMILAKNSVSQEGITEVIVVKDKRNVGYL